MSLCLASKKPSEREFFVPAGTDLGVKLLEYGSTGLPPADISCINFGWLGTFLHLALYLARSDVICDSKCTIHFVPFSAGMCAQTDGQTDGTTLLKNDHTF